MWISIFFVCDNFFILHKRTHNQMCHFFIQFIINYVCAHVICYPKKKTVWFYIPLFSFHFFSYFIYTHIQSIFWYSYLFIQHTTYLVQCIKPMKFEHCVGHVGSIITDFFFLSTPSNSFSAHVNVLYVRQLIR